MRLEQADQLLVSLAARRGARVPTLREYSAPRPFWKVKQRMPAVLAASTRVLDILNDGLQNDVYKALASLPHLTTIRSVQRSQMHDAINNGSPVPHFIAFSSQQRNEEGVLHLPLPLPVRYTILTPLVPHGVRHAVLNLQLDVSDHLMYFLALEDSFPSTLEAMTIIFTPLYGPRATPDPPANHDFTGFHKRFRMFWLRLVHHAPRVRFTMVGVDGLRPEILLGPGNSWDSLAFTQQSFHEYMVSSLEKVAMYFRIEGTTREDLDKNTQWFTHQEYRERTDPAQWELEMIR